MGWAGWIVDHLGEAPGVGRPLTDTVRLHVEILEPTGDTANEWGGARWGAGRWTGPTWTPWVWRDLTGPIIGLTTSTGRPDPAGPWEPAQVTVELHDPDGVLAGQLTTGCPLRVGFTVGAGWWPHIVGRVDTVTDPRVAAREPHDRRLTLAAVGALADLAAWELPDTNRSAELSYERVEALVAATNYAFELTVSAETAPNEVQLVSDSVTGNLRAYIDRCCLSAAAVLVETPTGIGYRAADTPDPPPSFLVDLDDPARSPVRVTTVTDRRRLLNIAAAARVPDNNPVIVTDPESIARWGPSGQAMGWPRLNLLTQGNAPLEAAATAAVAAFAGNVTRVEAVAVDVAAAPALAEPLARAAPTQRFTLIDDLDVAQVLRIQQVTHVIVAAGPDHLPVWAVELATTRGELPL